MLIVQLERKGDTPLTDEQLTSTRSVIEARLAALGVQTMITAIPGDRLRIEIADATPRETVGRLATSEGDLDFRAVPRVWDGQGTSATRLFGSEAIAAARPATTPDGQPAIDIDLRPEAVDAFETYAAAHPGWRLAVFVEGGAIKAPPFEAPGFDGHAQIPVPIDISGPDEMIAIMVSGGPLPINTGVMEECPVVDGCPGAEIPVDLAPTQSAPMASPLGATSVVIVQLHGSGGGSLTADQLTAAGAVVRARLAALGVAASVATIPDDRLRIDIADPSRADAVKRVATAPGVFEFVHVPKMFADAIADGGPLPAGMVVVPLFGNEGVAAARLGESQSGQIAVDIDLQPAAAQAFDAYAAEHQGERFAIVLDGTVIEAPTINATSFNGHAEISGSFDVQGARELIAILTGGVLPVAAEVLIVCPATGDCSGPHASPSDAPGG